MVDYHERMLELTEEIAAALGGGGVGIKIEDGTVEGRLMKVNADGSIDVNADLEVSDIQIGAVEIKDHDSTNRANVDVNGRLEVQSYQFASGDIAREYTESVALTTSWASRAVNLNFGGSLFIRNNEDAGGGSIYFSLRGTGSEIDNELKPGQAIVMDNVHPLAVVRMKGENGGEKYNLIAWG